MPYLGELQTLLEWLLNVYGAVSTVLIVLVAYQAYLLRRSHKEAEYTRVHLIKMMERNLQVQHEFISALTELRLIVERNFDGSDQREDSG